LWGGASENKSRNLQWLADNQEGGLKHGFDLMQPKFGMEVKNVGIKQLSSRKCVVGKFVRVFISEI
jgi:hypothetical protein